MEMFKHTEMVTRMVTKTKAPSMETWMATTINNLITMETATETLI